MRRFKILAVLPPGSALSHPHAAIGLTSPNPFEFCFSEIPEHHRDLNSTPVMQALERALMCAQSASEEAGLSTTNAQGVLASLFQTFKYSDFDVFVARFDLSDRKRRNWFNQIVTRIFEKDIPFTDTQLLDPTQNYKLQVAWGQAFWFECLLESLVGHQDSSECVLNCIDQLTESELVSQIGFGYGAGQEGSVYLRLHLVRRSLTEPSPFNVDVSELIEVLERGTDLQSSFFCKVNSSRCYGWGQTEWTVLDARDCVVSQNNKTAEKAVKKIKKFLAHIPKTVGAAASSGLRYGQIWQLISDNPEALVKVLTYLNSEIAQPSESSSPVYQRMTDLIDTYFDASNYRRIGIAKTILSLLDRLWDMAQQFTDPMVFASRINQMSFAMPTYKPIDICVFLESQLQSLTNTLKYVPLPPEMKQDLRDNTPFFVLDQSPPGQWEKNKERTAQLSAIYRVPVISYSSAELVTIADRLGLTPHIVTGPNSYFGFAGSRNAINLVAPFLKQLAMDGFKTPGEVLEIPQAELYRRFQEFQDVAPETRVCHADDDMAVPFNFVLTMAVDIDPYQEIHYFGRNTVRLRYPENALLDRQLYPAFDRSISTSGIACHVTPPQLFGSVSGPGEEALRSGQGLGVFNAFTKPLIHAATLRCQVPDGEIRTQYLTHVPPYFNAFNVYCRKTNIVDQLLPVTRWKYTLIDCLQDRLNVIQGRPSNTIFQNGPDVQEQLYFLDQLSRFQLVFNVEAIAFMRQQRPFDSGVQWSKAPFNIGPEAKMRIDKGVDRLSDQLELNFELLASIVSRINIKKPLPLVQREVKSCIDAVRETYHITPETHPLTWTIIEIVSQFGLGIRMALNPDEGSL